MTISILKDILISKNQIEKYFEGTTPVNLWRALNVKRNTHPFDFIEQASVLSNGRPRSADVKIEIVRGVSWIRVKGRPRGLSTFDKPGLPAGKHWEYYKIPEGTRLPLGLAIVRDEYNTKFNATHYTLAPAYDMPLEHFKMLLNQLAHVLVKEAI